MAGWTGKASPLSMHATRLSPSLDRGLKPLAGVSEMKNTHSLVTMYITHNVCMYAVEKNKINARPPKARYMRSLGRG